MSSLPAKYQDIVVQLKEKIRLARLKATYTLNADLLAIYWEIGKTVLDQQESEGWGAKVIDRLANDLKSEFPDMKGLSVRNIKYMRAFAAAYPEFLSYRSAQNFLSIGTNTIVQVPPAQLTSTPEIQNVQALLAQLTWYHHITLLDKIKDPATRFFYIQKTVENGWSRDVMVHQIEAELHKRQGQIASNFNLTIAKPQSELVQQVFKDPYKFEFIYLGQEAKERDLEDALTNQLQKFLLELGQWFAFMGRQYKITLGENEYFYDLLFYHTRLKRYIVIDLKIDEFKPEYKGKMEFYLNLADEQLKSEGDEPSIGLILCKTKDGLVAEYALRGSNKPIGIAEYQISDKLPAELKGELPTVEQLEVELDREVERFQKPIDEKFSKLKELVNGLRSEEVKEKRSPEKTSVIFKELVLPLKQNIIESLRKEIIPLFESVDCLIYTDYQGHRSEDVAVNFLEKTMNNQCQIFKIELQFQGFKKVGKKAFDLWKDIRIQLGNYTYSCVLGNASDKLLEKLYHQLPGETELTLLTEKFCESLIDDLTKRIEQITGVGNE